ncbi:glucosaminidase domain-containing protein [Enterococcus sp. DIV0756]|uniref:glucosaminidase domain-containing protein n=1 Tax=Enterococcus sp. DIV0756 TaxID=2774636 RepID=UPI003F2251B2
MKKIVMVICGVAVVCWGVASLRSGALKADNVLQDSSVVETAVPESSTVAQAPATPEPVPEAPAEPAPVPETPAPTTPPQASSVAPETPVEQPIESEPVDTVPETPTQSSTSEPPKSDSATSESSTSSGATSESSTGQSSTNQTSSTSNSSTTPSETSTSSSATSGSSASSSAGGSTGTTGSYSTVPSSSGQEQPSSPSAPGTVPSPAPTPPASSEPKVQTNPAVIQQTPDAFSATSALQLPSDLKTSEVAQSDLKGYELPLLTSFENKAHAALIYDGIKKLGLEQEQDFSVEQLATKLYEELFAIEITGTPEKPSEEISVGSLLYQKNKDQLKLVGIYIGRDYYLTVEDVEIDSAKETTETGKNDVVEIDAEKTADEETDQKEKQRQVVLQPINIDEDLMVLSLPTVTLTEYGQTILAEYPASINFTENEGTKTFISRIAEDARKLGQEYDVFASVMIAQALLESGSGTSSLSLPPNHNLFGVKGTYQGQAVSMATQEDRGNGELYSINSAFRKYPNYAASLGDYVQLLRGGISGNDSYYKDTWRSTAKNYLRSTQALTGKYATDTSYNRKLNSIIAVYNLTQYDRVKVDQSSGIFIKGKDEIPEEYRTMMRYPDYNGVNYNTSGSYPVGQCTWYAFNRVKQLGKSVDDFMGNGGEWETKGKALGYEISREPKAGWLISFTPGTAGSDPRYGHVAFVEVVRPEGILISEGNVYGGTVISYRVIDSNLAKSDLVTYIKAK